MKKVERVENKGREANIDVCTNKYMTIKKDNKILLVETELVGLIAIQDLIELVLWTTYVKEQNPVSIFIIAEPESGKTALMGKYRENNGVISRKRFTAYGIQQDLINHKIKLVFNKPKLLGHILIYDFSAIYSFKQDTIGNTIDFLDALTEDGISSESSYAIGSDELKEFEGLKGGVIAGINTYGFFTNSDKKKIRANILRGGLFSRFLVVSFDVSEKLIREIFDSIKNEEYRTDKKFVNLISLNFPIKRIDIDMPIEYKDELEQIVDDIRERLEKESQAKIKGLRLLKALIGLVKASALRDGRSQVNKSDIDRIRYLSNWMNLSMNNLKTNYPFGGECIE
jgi:hypothetical protein